jgi:hypothetical protein
LRKISAAGVIDIAMKAFHEWLGKGEGLWLNNKTAVICISNINPLLKKKAKLKPLELPKAKVSVVKTPKTIKAVAPAAFKPKGLPMQSC